MDTYPIKTNTVEIKGKAKSGKVKVVKYDRSFLSLIIQNTKAKGYYSDLKNYFLSFEKVKSRTAWGAENFMVGSEAVVRLVVRAGVLCALFALDPNAYKQKEYPHLDYSADKDYKSTPFFVPVRNAAECKIARRMASEAFTLRCVYTLDFPARTDYVAALPTQKDETLVKKGFIKKSEIMLSEADAKKAIAAAIKAEADEQKELEFFDVKKPPKKKAEPEPLPEPIAEETEEAEERSDEEDVVFEIAEDGVLLTIYFDRSFVSRIIQNDKAKHYYGEIKNYALSFGVKSRISWHADRFYRGRVPYLLAKVRGKTLCLYLALDPSAYESRIYHHTDVSDKKCYAKTPMMIRVKSDLGLKKAKKLIGEMLTAAGLDQKELAPVNYPALYPYEETDALINRNLIKRIERKPWEAMPKAGDEIEDVDFELAEEPLVSESDVAESRRGEVDACAAAESETISEESAEKPAEGPAEDSMKNAAEEEEVEEVVFELADDDEEDIEEVTFELAEENDDGEDDAEDVTFELAEEPSAEGETSEMEVYGDEDQEGRYVTLKKYMRGFTAKMRQGESERKDYYAEIKAKLLSYQGVKVSESFSGDSFKKGSRLLLKSRIRGKTLCLFYALNVDNYKQTVYRQQYKGDVKAYASTPMMIRVRSEQGLARAVRLIEEMERNYLLTAGEPVSVRDVRATYNFEETTSLVEKGLIKTKLVTVTQYEAEQLLKRTLK